MKDNLEASWSWLLPDQQRILRDNPSGPVPDELVPLLHKYGLLGAGTKVMISPTGSRQTFLSPRVARFIEGVQLAA
jgi:hypothetical protein